MGPQREQAAPERTASGGRLSATVVLRSAGPHERPPTPAETAKTSITHAYLKIDYATAVVDPVDDETFWIIHEYADNDDVSHDDRYWTAVVGHVSATLP